MLRAILFSAVLAILCGLTLNAADITGKWAGEVSTPNGTFPLKFTFAQEGDKLSGSMVGPEDEMNPLYEGKIDGDSISFSVKISYNGGMTVHYSGTVKGEEILLNLTVDEHDFEADFSLKREN
jgi:hypothetical protein